MRAVLRCEPPWICFDDAGFAGPRTQLRGARVDEDEPRAFEVVDAEAQDAAHVSSLDGRELWFVPSAAGATLGEIVDESAKQGARLDTSFAFAILAPLVPHMLANVDPHGDGEHLLGLPAISVDHVLVGFDGVARFRGHLPWWGARTAPRVPPGLVSATPGWQTQVLIGQALETAVTSRRVRAGLSLPNVDALVRDDVRNLIVRLVESGLIVGTSRAWFDNGPPEPADTAERFAAIRARLPAVDAGSLGAMVRQLFPARFEKEREIAERIAAER